jgi:hypothetical protein
VESKNLHRQLLQLPYLTKPATKERVPHPSRFCEGWDVKTRPGQLFAFALAVARSKSVQSVKIRVKPFSSPTQPHKLK